MSLKEEIDGDFIANTIRMDDVEGYYVLVEGETDELFYSKFLNSELTQIEICHGKQNVLDAIKILDEANVQKKYFGIADKDYDFLDLNSFQSKNLIRTDYHDVETMCIASDSFENIVKEYFNNEKIKLLKQDSSKSIVDHILDIAKPIAELRVVSINHNYKLKFKPSGIQTKELDYTKFVCKDNFCFKGVESLLETIKKYYNQAVHIPNEELVEKINNTDLSNYEILDICHGHDITKIIVVGMKKAIGKSNLSNTKPDDIERAMRLTFSKEDFYKTDLKKNIESISMELIK